MNKTTRRGGLNRAVLRLDEIRRAPQAVLGLGVGRVEGERGLGLEERVAGPVEAEQGLRAVRVERRHERRLGSKRVIQRRFNMSVPRARVPEKASTLRGRSKR